GDVRPTASPISRTDGGYPRSRSCCSMKSRIWRCRGVSLCVDMASSYERSWGDVKHLFRQRMFPSVVDIERRFWLTANVRFTYGRSHLVSRSTDDLLVAPGARRAAPPSTAGGAR